jgi:surfeit locus 1 family protein
MSKIPKPPVGLRALLAPRWVASFLMMSLVVGACAWLGLWQWDRAATVRASEVPAEDSARVPLQFLLQPRDTLPSTAAGRLVIVAGEYVDRYVAPDRFALVGDRRGDWDVALLKTEEGAGILIVRGWRDPTQPLPSGRIAVQGRLLPSQEPDEARRTSDSLQLSRINSALLLSRVDFDLYDGFIVASQESPAQSSGLDLIEAPQPRTAPGYFLQHAIYVVLWWFFGLMAVVVWLRSARDEVIASRRGREPSTDTVSP